MYSNYNTHGNTWHLFHSQTTVCAQLSRLFPLLYNAIPWMQCKQMQKLMAQKKMFKGMLAKFIYRSSTQINDDITINTDLQSTRPFSKLRRNDKIIIIQPNRTGKKFLIEAERFLPTQALAFWIPSCAKLQFIVGWIMLRQMYKWVEKLSTCIRGCG